MYQLKEQLVQFELNSLIDLEDPFQKWTFGYVTRKLVTVGLNRFVAAWNNHRIPGPNRGIPSVRAIENSRVTPATLNFTMSDLIQQYRRSGGTINDDFSDLWPFNEASRNDQLMNMLAQFNSSYELIYNRMLLNDTERVIFP